MIGRCGHELTGQQRAWCSVECQKEAARAALLLQRFNLTIHDYNQIVDYQSGLCAVCGKPPKDGKRLVTDHSHKTGLVRGALCTRCNLVIVAKHTDPFLLQQAANYLSDPPARRALGRDVIAPGRPAKKRRSRRKKAA